MALTEVEEGVTVGREGSCERMLRGLRHCCEYAGVLRCYGISRLTLLLEQAQMPGESLEAELVVGLRPWAQKRSEDSVC